MTRTFATLLLAVFLTSDGFAHSGGLDANGCHAGSQPYHCHRAPSEMVGNRLRCDLGSRSSECDVGSPYVASDIESSKQSASAVSASDNSGAPSVNRFTTLDDFKIKNATCVDGKWALDGINLASYHRPRVSWTVYTVDEDGDPLETHNDSTWFSSMQRKQISMGISCDIPFEELNLQFR